MEVKIGACKHTWKYSIQGKNRPQIFFNTTWTLSGNFPDFLKSIQGSSLNVGFLLSHSLTTCCIGGVFFSHWHAEKWNSYQADAFQMLLHGQTKSDGTFLYTFLETGTFSFILHTMLRYPKFLPNSSLGINLLGAKRLFYTNIQI